MHEACKGKFVLLLSYLLLMAATCEEPAEPGPSPDDLTKEKRERLGDLLHQQILASPNDFPILNRPTKGDSVILTYLQTLYNQATHQIRMDRSSSENNRWDRERPWRVTVIDNNNRYAFSAPGGNLYISTGLLKGLNKGYEIYYLMAFEAANVSERFLLDNLSTEYSIATLLSITESPEVFSPEVLEEITNYLKKDIEYESIIVQEIDKITATIICESSIFDRFGIIPILKILDFREQWRDTRPSYADRLEYLNSLRIEDCGSVKATGAYQKMVKDNL